MVTVSNIANASRGKLLCMTYELLLKEVQKLIECEDRKEQKKYVDKSVEIIKMLVGSLDFDYELSCELFRVYVYVQGLIIKGRTVQEFQEAYKLVDKIYSAYKQVAEKDSDQTPVMQNAEAVYAGLTYGRDDLNVMSVVNSNRGFKV